MISLNKNDQHLDGKDYIYPPMRETGCREAVMLKMRDAFGKIIRQNSANYGWLHPEKQTKTAAQPDDEETKNDDYKSTGCSHFVVSKKQESRKTL